MENNYIVYTHTLPNDKIYVGYLNLSGKFANGRTFDEIMDNGNFHENKDSLYADIQDCGWEQVRTETISGLTKEQAIEKKKSLCLEYQSYLPEFGYNRYADAGLKQPNKKSKVKMIYTVYAHVTPNKKVYIGQTNEEKAENRWHENGEGYINNKEFYKAILQYGWENINHIIICKNLSKKQANYLEEYLIKKYHATDPECGYNKHNGGDLIDGIGLKFEIAEYIAKAFLDSDITIIKRIFYFAMKYTKPELRMILKYIKGNANYISQAIQNKEFESNKKKAAYIFEIIKSRSFI